MLVADQIAGGLAAPRCGVRRRWPFESPSCCLLLTSFSETAGGASAVALIAVAIHGTIRQAHRATRSLGSSVASSCSPDPDRPSRSSSCSAC